MHWPPASGSESTTCALRPSNPSSNAWNRPTGPAPTITTSVSIAGPSISASCASGDTRVLPAPLGRRSGLRERAESLLREPLGIEKPRGIAGAAVAQDGHYRVAGPQCARHAYGRG